MKKIFIGALTVLLIFIGGVSATKNSAPVEDSDYFIRLAEAKLQETPPSLESQRDALEFAQKAVQSDPESSAARYTEGRAKFDLVRFGQAHYSFSKAVELNPNFEQALYMRGVSSICMHHDSTDLRNAVEDFKRVLSLNPNSAKTYFALGDCYLFLEEYDLSVENFNKGFELDSGTYNSYNNRGRAYAALKDYERAIADFDKAIELRADFDVAYHNRSSCYAALGDAAQAQADADKARELGYRG